MREREKIEGHVYVNSFPWELKAQEGEKERSLHRDGGMGISGVSTDMTVSENSENVKA